MRNAGAVVTTLGAVAIGLVVGLFLLAPLLTVSPARTRGMEGEVRCVDNIAVTVAPHPDLAGDARFENIVHEAVHMNQFAINCDSVALAWRNDPAFRLELEAQATCIGLAVYSDTSGRSVRRAERVTRIAHAYLSSLGNTLGFEDIWAALDRWCPNL